ncbi:HNH endonuclease [Hymenobacter sp. M29]|uniref:HNH endonuclease n=1 Tax=Hymenobacter mellowenesis TaxID=3063995 RepID=A0ABT9AIJ9_9BACT|nr:HNH endonuclease [Hymenobacter sp. M29]MDO7849689.1 HNH endonuclease [Hymenobacter sp. M29]
METQTEIWKDCEGFAGVQVSNHGNIKNGDSSIATYKKDGYVNVSMRGIAKQVHRLVAAAFCPKPAGCDIVNHIDGSRDNNYFANLEWTTVKGNAVHAAQNNMLAVGESHARTDLTKTIVLGIDALLREGKANGEVAETYGVSREVVSKIKAGRTWAKVTGRELAPITRINAVGKSKLTAEQVANVRQRVAAGESMRSVAASYNLSHTTVVALINGQTWN